MAIGVYAGLRIAELHQLDVEDVDLEDLTVRVRHGKGDKERIVPLHRKAAAAVRGYLVHRNDAGSSTKPTSKQSPSCPLFLSRLGRRLSIRAMRDVVYRLAGDAELRKSVHPHTLRHTFATLFLDANPEDIRVLQVLLGHASIATTEIYTFVSQARKRRGVDKM